MGKPQNAVYERFTAKYEQLNREMGMRQFVVPYLMSSHPGSTLTEAVALAEYLHAHHLNPEQVSDFYPTPSTISTVMYYTGLDPRTMEPVYVATNPHEKAMQRALIQYRNPKNYDLVHEALLKAGRADLIGYEPQCLIRPRKSGGQKSGKSANGKPGGSKSGGGNHHSGSKKPQSGNRKPQQHSGKPRKSPK